MLSPKHTPHLWFKDLKSGCSLNFQPVFISDYSHIGQHPDNLIIVKKQASKVRFGKKEICNSTEQMLNASIESEIKGKRTLISCAHRT